ncbi:hypothetical protein GGR34_003293 [Microvirga flocculans]|uniref:Uncharacterized protein n=1 Tax=Microvirga flocculans TaxID=217168 RepID=A0A7W6IHI6_9HYPH|nr:hypothetical protein [Microvirga flocculans]MBB4041615.1 hypothetical protein [Microvirga flocculans]
MIWNFINYRRTTGLQKQIRYDTVKLEEFRRVRSVIDTVLTELGSERQTLRGISASGVTIEELRTQVGERQVKLVEIFDRLEVALQKADQSDFASGKDWTATVHGTWDRFNTTIDKVYSPHRREEEARAAPAEAAKILNEMICAVDQRLETEMKRFVGQHQGAR